jgi:hypothetical protein
MMLRVRVLAPNNGLLDPPGLPASALSTATKVPLITHGSISRGKRELS